MGKKKDLTLEKQNRINILHSTGHSLNFIARTIGVNKSTVSRTMYRINERRNYSSATKKRRPRIISPQTDRHIPLWYGAP